jgi:hypothetical protein
VGRSGFGGAVAAAVVVLVLVAGCGTDESGGTATEDGSVPAGVVPIDGFADRQEPAVAAVGDRLFVFGGQVPPTTGRDARARFLNDGVLVDPTSGDAEKVPDPPFDRPLAHPVAQRIGDDVLVIGSSCIASEPTEGNAEFCEPDTYAAATFDPRSRQWERVELPPDLRTTGGYRRALGAIDNDRAVLVLGREQPDVWTYAPSDGRWAKAPVSLSADNVCLAGSDAVELVLTEDVTKSSTASLRITDLATGAKLDSTRLPGVTYRPFINGYVRCNSAEILVVDPGVVGGAAGLHRYDRESGTWSTVPAPPVDLFGFRSVWADDELVFLPTPGAAGQQAYALNPATGRWRTIADPPINPQDPVWNGRAVVGYTPSTIAPDGSPGVICLRGETGGPPTTSGRPECKPDYRPPEPRRTRAGVWSFTVPSA